MKMLTYHGRIPYSAVLLAAGLVVASPTKNDARVVETNVAKNSIDSIADVPLAYSPADYTSRSHNFASQSAAPSSQGLLDLLISNASVIFYGRAQKIEDGPQIDPPHLAGRGKKITFEILEGFKGDLKQGSQFVVNTPPEIPTSVYENKEVVWYLPQKSSYGFQLPINILLGDFTVVESERGRTVFNGSANRGLWNENGNLWNSSNEKDLARQYLLNHQLAADYVDRTLGMGEINCCPERISLDLLLAATHAKIASKSSAPNPR